MCKIMIHNRTQGCTDCQMLQEGRFEEEQEGLRNTVEGVQGGTVEGVQGGTVEVVQGDTVVGVQGGTVEMVQGGSVEGLHGKVLCHTD